MTLTNNILKNTRSSQVTLSGVLEKSPIAYIFPTRKPEEGGIGWPGLETSVIANKLLNLLDIVFSSDETSQNPLFGLWRTTDFRDSLKNELSGANVIIIEMNHQQLNASSPILPSSKYRDIYDELLQHNGNDSK